MIFNIFSCASWSSVLSSLEKCLLKSSVNFSIAVQSLSHVLLFATPWTASCQASLSFTISQSLLKFISIESVMLSNHLILCCTLRLLISNFPSIRIFSSELILHIRWPKYWTFSFNLCFLILSYYKRYLYILQINPLSVASFANILLFHRLSFHLVYGFFCCAKLVNLNRSHLFISAFISITLADGQKNMAAIYVKECSDYVNLL